MYIRHKKKYIVFGLCEDKDRRGRYIVSFMRSKGEQHFLFSLTQDGRLGAWHLPRGLFDLNLETVPTKVLSGKVIASILAMLKKYKILPSNVLWEIRQVDDAGKIPREWFTLDPRTPFGIRRVLGLLETESPIPWSRVREQLALAMNPEDVRVHGNLYLFRMSALPKALERIRSSVA